MGKIIAVIFATLFFNSLLWSAESDLPLPADAMKIMEKNIDVGPAKSLARFYKTQIPAGKLTAFYKKEMIKSGWQQSRENLFEKDGYFAVVAITPPGLIKDNKTHFSITVTRMPTEKEMLSTRKADPDKLNFMPIYPGSVQGFLWDTPTGLSASYETKSSMRDVIFFYKSQMLNYGWTLYNETPVATTESDDSPGSSSHASLIFRRSEKESCIINIYETKLKQPPALSEKKADNAQNFGIISVNENKTRITVTYNDFKLPRK
jgi:hypothetical protein